MTEYIIFIIFYSLKRRLVIHSTILGTTKYFIHNIAFPTLMDPLMLLYKDIILSLLFKQIMFFQLFGLNKYVYCHV